MKFKVRTSKAKKLLASYTRPGAWTTSISFHYMAARLFHSKFKILIEEISSIENRVRQSYLTDNSMKLDDLSELDYIIDEQTNNLTNEAFATATSTHLFACMTIESFINFYGVKRMGEVFYKQNIERVGITEKLAIIVLSCKGKLLGQDDNIVKALRRLFDKRNQLVHPKTREIKFDDNGEISLDMIQEYSTPHPRDLDLDIESSILAMEQMIDWLCEFDSNIFRDEITCMWDNMQ
jgi:hypothetical protein